MRTAAADRATAAAFSWSPIPRPSLQRTRKDESAQLVLSMSKGKRGAPRGNNRVGAAMADRERARCHVAHLGHERGNSRSTNSQNAKGSRPLTAPAGGGIGWGRYS